MKKIVIFLLLMPVLLCADELETIQYSPILINHADSNDTALDPNSSYWGVCEDWEDIPIWMNSPKVCFYAYDPNDPNDETFSYQLYVADYGSNAQLVGYGNATVGGSKLSHRPDLPETELNSGAIDPNYAWVDMLGTITSDWLGGSRIYAQNDAGGDGVAAFIFDRTSAKKVWCRIYGRSNAYLEVYCIAYGY